MKCLNYVVNVDLNPCKNVKQMIPNGQKQITWCVKIRTYRIDLYKWNLPGGRKKLKKLINNNCCYHNINICFCILSIDQLFA